MTRRGRHARDRGYNGQSKVSLCGPYRLTGDERQLEKKYLEMSDRADTEIEAENFRQHAEHYRRQAKERSVNLGYVSQAPVDTPA